MTHWNHVHTNYKITTTSAAAPAPRLHPQDPSPNSPPLTSQPAAKPLHHGQPTSQPSTHPTISPQPSPPPTFDRQSPGPNRTICKVEWSAWVVEGEEDGEEH